MRLLVPREYQIRGKLSPWVAFLQALLFFGYGGFPAIYLPQDWPAVSLPLGFHIAGAAILWIGLALLFYGICHLGLIQSLGHGESHLAVTGIYSFSRNPQAVACGFYVLGFLTLWPSCYSVGWALLYLPLIHWMVMAEEAHLEHVFGLEFREYSKKVPRYFRSPSPQ